MNRLVECRGNSQPTSTRRWRFDGAVIAVGLLLGGLLVGFVGNVVSLLPL
jgi:hypothetical protein